MKRELLIATGNQGKLKEMLAVIGEVPFQVVTLSDIQHGAEVEEPAETLEGNALIKAFTYGTRSGLLTLAEDTGLFVDALPDKLGVKTARYDKDDASRNERLLNDMADVPDERRGATFRTVVAIYDPLTQKVRTVSGECRGRIMRNYEGEHGFGFSPLFFVDETQKRLAEMSYEELRPINHRGKAVTKAGDILRAEFV